MSGLRDFESAPDLGSPIPKGRGIWESSIEMGVLVQCWYAPTEEFSAELAKRLTPLAPEDLVDLNPLRDDEHIEYDDSEKADVASPSEETINLGELTIVLDDVSSDAQTDSAPEIEPDVDSAEEPDEMGWDLDWSTPEPVPEPVVVEDIDDDPYG